MDSKLVLLLGSDDTALLNSHRQILEILGYQIVTFSSEQGAEKLITRLEPELICALPGRGIEAARKLERHLPGLKIVELEPGPVLSVTRPVVPAKVAPKTEQTHVLEEALYARKEAAWSLGISIRSLDTLLASKQLAFRRLGRKVMNRLARSGGSPVRTLTICRRGANAVRTATATFSASLACQLLGALPLG